MSSENYLIRDQNTVHFLTFTVINWNDIFSRAMMVEKTEDYLASSARNYASLESLLEVEVI